MSYVGGYTVALDMTARDFQVSLVNFSKIILSTG